MRRLLREIAVPVQLALLALGLAVLVLLLFGESPYHLGKALLRGAFGTHTDLARGEGLYARLYAKQLAV